MSTDFEIRRSEWRWVAVFVLVILILTSVPYWLAKGSQGQAWIFSGHLLAVEDGNSYFGKMLSGAAGAWRFRTPYTAYPQDGVFSFLPYILLGKLSGSDYGRMVMAFHSFRWLAGAVMIAGSYAFIAHFIEDVRWRRVGVVLAAFGGGLGWALVLASQPGWLGSLPLDFISPESFGFLALFALPHLAMARGLLLLGFLAFLRGRGVLAGLLWLLMGIFNPVPPVLAWGISAVFIVVLLLKAWRRSGPEALRPIQWAKSAQDSPVAYVRAWLPAVLLPLPLILYTAIAFASDPFLKNWAGQNLILSPPIGHYLLAYGLLLPLAILGIRPLLQSRPVSGWLPVVWMGLLPVLAYAPHNFQRRFVEGLWLSVIVLAIRALQPSESTTVPGPRQIYGRAAVGLSMLSAIFLIVGSLGAALNPFSPVFRTIEEVHAFEFLVQEAQAGDVVLTSFETGNVLPAFAPIYVVIGHGPESIFLDRLRPRVEAFYQPETLDSQRLELLQDFDVRFVWWGAAEQSLGSWNPDQAAYLRPVYQDDLLKVFEVVR